MGIEAYLNHHQSCNIMQDWFEAEDALLHADPGPDRDAAWEEMNRLRNTCTCGKDKVLKSFASSWYVKGWQDASESGDEQEIREIFDRNYGDLIVQV